MVAPENTEDELYEVSTISSGLLDVRGKTFGEGEARLLRSQSSDLFLIGTV